MKKAFTLSTLVLLTLPVMTACPKEDTPDYTETRTEAEVIEALAKQALNEVGVAYAKYSSDGLALGNNSLITSVNKKVYEGDDKGLNFSLTYTLEADEEYTKEFVTLDSTANVLKAEIVTEADLNTTITKALGGLAYTLKATIKFAGYAEGFSVHGLETTTTASYTGTDEWGVLDMACISGPIDYCKQVARNNQYVSFKGQVNGWISNKITDMYTGVFVTDGSDGMMLYAGKIDEFFFNENKEQIINEGDYVDVFGIVSIYNGLMEIKPSNITRLTNPDDYAEVKPLVVETMTADQVAGIKTPTTGNLVCVRGLKLKSGFDIDAKLKDGAHWTIPCVDGADKEVNLYVNYHMGNEEQAKIKTFLKGLKDTDRFMAYGATSMSGTTKPTIQIIGNTTRSAGESLVLDNII